MKRLTGEQLKMISDMKKRGMKPTAISEEMGISIDTISYHFYPNLKEKHKEYLKGYRKRPYVRHRANIYHKKYNEEHYTKRKLFIDLFADFETGYTFEDIRRECGGRPGKIRDDLNAYEGVGVLIKTVENGVEVYRFNKKFGWFLKKKESKV